MHVTIRTISWLTATLTILPFLPGQDESAAISRFRGAFRSRPTSKSLDRKRDALAELRNFDSAALAKALIGAVVNLEREAERLRAARRPILEVGGGSQKLGPLRQQLQPVRNLQKRLILRLQQLRSPGAVGAMLTQFLRSGRTLPWTLQCELAARTTDLPAAAIESLIDSTTSIKRDGGIVVMLQALSPLGRRAEKAASWAAQQLLHGNIDVRIQAAKTLGRLCWPGSLDPLVAGLETERGAVREAILDALVILTGKNIGSVPSAWRHWLTTEGGPYRRGEQRLGTGSAKMRQRQPGSVQTTGSYFGIEQSGQSIIYVFDVSLSMRAGMTGEKPPRGQGAGALAPNSRWQRCRQELHRALSKLTPDKTFNLITFADHVEMFAPRMQKANKRVLARAHEWIDDRKLEYETNVHDALELAFYIAGRGTKDRYYPIVADTIFFLSDGAPTIRHPKSRRRLRPDQPSEILDAVQSFNALGRITIHTIGLGLRRPGRRPRKFLRQLALRNGGRFVEPNRP